MINYYCFTTNVDGLIQGLHDQEHCDEQSHPPGDLLHGVDEEADEAQADHGGGGEDEFVFVGVGDALDREDESGTWEVPWEAVDPLLWVAGKCNQGRVVGLQALSLDPFVASGEP